MENLKIISEKENPLFKRKEIQAEIESEISPKKDGAKKLISEKFKTSEENIKIKKISGRFGSKTFRIDVNIYLSKQDKDKIEPKEKKEATKKGEEHQEKQETKTEKSE